MNTMVRHRSAARWCSLCISLVAVEFLSVPVKGSDSLRGGAERSAAAQRPAILAAVGIHFQYSECRARVGRTLSVSVTMERSVFTVSA